MKRLFLLIAILILWTGSPHAQASYVYVSTAGSDTNNGKTPGTPLRTLQAGVNACGAATLPCTVYAKAGNYGEAVVINSPGGTQIPNLLTSYGGASSTTSVTVNAQGWTVDPSIAGGIAPPGLSVVTDGTTIQGNGLPASPIALKSGAAASFSSLTAPAGSAGTISGFNVPNVVNVTQAPYGASGSANTYTCSISSGSLVLTCTTATDFQKGQYVAIPTAGQASQVSAPSIGAVTNIRTTGASNDCYEIVSADLDQGILTPSSCACQASGPAAGAFSTKSGLAVAFTPSSSTNSINAIYRTIGTGVCTGASFVNIAGGSPYNDYGQDLPKPWGWPATAPTATNETAYCKIMGGSGTTWTVDCTDQQGQATARNTATSVTVMHDDTVAVQAAADAAAHSILYFPSGTYRLNEMFYVTGGLVTSRNPATSSTYSAGSIWLRTTAVQVMGAGRDKTFIRQDFAGSASYHSAVFVMSNAAIFPANGPQQSNGTARYTSYAFNAATKYSTSITMTTAADAGHFSPGDVVFLTGGQNVDATYTTSNITKVLSANATTGVIQIANGITTDLPFGSGITNFIENLTTNNAIQEQISFEDFTLNTPNVPFSGIGIYGFTLRRLLIPEVPTYTQGLFYGQWWANTQIQDSDIQLSNWQDTVNSYVNITNTRIKSIEPLVTIQIGQGGTSPLTVSNSDFAVTCGSTVDVFGNVADFTFIGNRVEETCPTGPSIADNPTLAFATGTSGATSYNWNINGNTIYSNARQAMAANSGNPMPPNTLVSNNTIWHQRTTGFSNATVALTGNVSFQNNRIFTNSAANTSGTIIQIGGLAANQATNYTGNVITQTGTDNDGCITVADPGSTATGATNITNNRCIGSGAAMAAGITIANTTNTPNVFPTNNILENITTPYNPVLTVANLPTTCLPGMHRLVTDWNGNNGACTGGGTNYVEATCGTSNGWSCP
jgi:hypothetical protein